MTRAEAKEFARKAALMHGRHHAYVPDSGDQFEPHEWVVVAILNAVNSLEYGMGTSQRGQEKAP